MLAPGRKADCHFGGLLPIADIADQHDIESPAATRTNDVFAVAGEIEREDGVGSKIGQLRWLPAIQWLEPDIRDAVVIDFV